MIHALRQTYERIPIGLRRLAGPVVRALPERLRYGRTFVDTRREIASVDRASREEQDAAQARRLASLVAAAWSSSYWREVFEDVGVTRNDPGMSVLSALPLLTKDDVRDCLEDMLTVPVSDGGRKWVTTGGTSGRPLGVWLDRDASVADWAFVTTAWGRVGFELDEPRVVIRGVRLGSGETREVVHYEPVRRELYVSAFDLDSEHLPRIRAAIASFRPRFLHGYPSSMEVLGRSYLEASEEPPPLVALLVVSENLYPGQRELLERLFGGARVFSFYGMTEKGAFAAECEHSSELHVEPLYGVVELVDEAGIPIQAPGIRGEIVVTGLLSRAVPLLRYRTGDFAAWADGACACGRAHRRLASVEGRWDQEYLVGGDGTRISMTALNVHSDVFDCVRRFQFRQERPGEATVLVEGGGAYTAECGELILRELDGKLSGHVVLRIEQVARIPTTERGKHRFIDQRIGTVR